MNQTQRWIRNHVIWAAVIGLIAIICLNFVNWKPDEAIGSYVFILIWIIIFPGGCAYYAKEKNRNPWLWAWLGFVGGFISLIVILTLKTKAN